MEVRSFIGVYILKKLLYWFLKKVQMFNEAKEHTKAMLRLKGLLLKIPPIRKTNDVGGYTIFHNSGYDSNCYWMGHQSREQRRDSGVDGHSSSNQRC